MHWLSRSKFRWYVHILIYLSLTPLNERGQFEQLIATTIEETKDIPEIISETGKVGMPHKGPLLQMSAQPNEPTYRFYRNYATNWRAFPVAYKHQSRRFRTRFTCMCYDSSCFSELTLLSHQEFFWVSAPVPRKNVLLKHLQSYPDLQPLYDAARSYLEIPQRVHLLNTRVEVCTNLTLSW